ncbi:MAG: ELM1/GtrOC1 family putative glycosyltransferase [Candidatus Omnitrophota bacterium]|nr:ELM1/GtrOC1 family putative glycosyltransferase [Candidatus Omnitrophota bacterium]
MKKDFIVDFLGFIIVKSFSVSLWFVPLRLALWLGRRMGDSVYFFNAKRRMIAYANLKAAFPEKSCAELKRINKAHFENLGMNVIELLKLPFMDKGYLERHVKLENADAIKSSLERGKGVIILTAHFGNWEIASLAASLNGYIMSVFAREQKYERLNNLLNQFRQSTGCKVVTKGFSVKDIIKTLHNNGIVAMLSDQDAGANGVFVNFFKRPASTAQGIIAFSSKTGAAILPSFITRVGIDKHIARAGDPLKLVNTGDKEKDMKVNLQRIAGILEDHIKKIPEQWLWAHKRWKTTPQRSVLVLTDGKAGHLNQAIGVAETVEGALGSRLKARGINEKPIVKIQVVEINFKNIFTKAFLNLMSIFASARCQGCLRCMRFCLTQESFENVKNKYADIIISCGASVVSANIFLKYENNAKNIVIMKPGLARSKKIDLIVLPRHDCFLAHPVGEPFGSPTGWARSNMLVIEGAPNRITDSAMREALIRLSAEGLTLKGDGGIGLLIGGDAKGFRLERNAVEKVLDAVIKISEEKNLDMFVSTSRRTSPEIDKLLKERLTGNKRCKLLIIANEKNTEGAVAGIFGLSDVVVTSPESMSMVSEAASSGKHVIVFRLKAQGSRFEGKYDQMVSNLEGQGYIKTAAPDEMYNKVKEILETRPEIKKLNDREKIEDRLKSMF